MRTNLKKKSIILMLVVLMAVTFFSFKPEAQAAAGWFLCTLNQAGPGWNTGFVVVTDSGGAFSTKYMISNSVTANQLIATALTAISLGKQLYIYCPDTTRTPYPYVDGALLIN